MQLMKLLMSIGGAVATTRLARSVSDLNSNDLLGLVGLSRRESHFGQGLLLFSGGAVVGAGVALLLAPASGQETRKMLGERFDKLSTAAGEKLREIQEDVPALLGREGSSQSPTGAATQKRHTGVQSSS
ncbi:MAG: YtxH domain-containing protein [Polyangiaceae bacterium]|nr:YtxH domain-containing protein [Polyangiaceae bacterium]